MNLIQPRSPWNGFVSSGFPENTPVFRPYAPSCSLVRVGEFNSIQFDLPATNWP